MPQRSMETPEAPKERYTGHELDGETNLVYAGARYYDPVIARWTAVDPLAEKHPDWTPYNYVLANPLLLYDPDGRQEGVYLKQYAPNWRQRWSESKNVAAQVSYGIADESYLFAQALTGSNPNDRRHIDGSLATRSEVTGSLRAAPIGLATGKGLQIGTKSLRSLLSRSIDDASDLATRSIDDVGEVVNGIVRGLIRHKAGFADEGLPLIIDNSLGVNPQQVAKLLRENGLNARSVGEIFGKDPGDASIRELAERIGGRVVAVDRGRDIGGGFERLTIQIDGRVRQPESILRIIEDFLNQ